MVQFRILNSQFGRVHFVWFITKVHIYFPLIQGSSGRSVNHPLPYLNCLQQDNWWWTEDQGSNHVDLWGGRLVLTSVNQPTPNLKNPPYRLNMRREQSLMKTKHPNKSGLGWKVPHLDLITLATINIIYYIYIIPLTVLIVGSLCKVLLIKLSFPLLKRWYKVWHV